MKFATNPKQHCPAHFRHVAALPWEIRNSNFLQTFADMEENAYKLHFYRLCLC